MFSSKLLKFEASHLGLGHFLQATKVGIIHPPVKVKLGPLFRDIFTLPCKLGPILDCMLYEH